MSRKGSKNLTESEKNLLISVINDYEVCNLSDKKMIEILSQKLGRSIKETSYYSLKNEAKKNRLTSEQWLDNFCRSEGIIDFYKKRLDELLLVQRTLLDLYADEASKKDVVLKQNRVLIAKLARTISDNSKILSELGTSPIVLAKLQSLIPREVLKGDLEFVDKYFENMDKDQKKLWSLSSDNGDEKENDEKEETKLDPSKATSAIFPPIDGIVNNKSPKGSNTKEATAQGDQRIF
jgi:hypothetical protein